MITSLVPDQLFAYKTLFKLLLPVAALFVAVGLLHVFQRSSCLADQLRGLVQVVATVALLANFNLAVQTAKTGVRRLVEEGLGAKPHELPMKFAKKLMGAEQPANDDGLVSTIKNFGAHLYHALLAGLIAMIALVALAMFFLGYLAQELALEMGIGLAPIFVGFLLLPATRGIGAQFLIYMLAIALFPLGWGVASLVSDKLIEVATRHDLAATKDTIAALSFAMRNLFGALLLGIWMIVSTIFAPFAILRAVTSGVHLSADAARAVRAVIRR